MLAMQYRITLPADYDMRIIRRRVETKGPLLDDFSGLGLKAYGIRERGVDGSPVHQYAPFYLWTAPEAMNRFLWGPGFQGVVRDFGRPSVEHWQGLAFERGPSAGAVPRTATRHATPVPVTADPAAAVEDALARLAERTRKDGVHTTALGIDPRGWELIHFTLWEGSAPPSEPGDRYQVLHLSTPDLDGLPRGRQW
ncbi:DUF4865 family protein [Streptomyces malaysiensis subsp. malaysiensis]|uniref:DUF4865 family protein n=1 Tax=Streptomyces malaysiensis TaxID=92644 RepID=UPI000BFD4927|nr:DUF4865 family protein [Streptomyces malaysiensis]ATL81007.1 hypothetical protein SMALA_0772 [Streptomyces malaysiensis]QDL74447.1 DUF4865 family protein [Streptomyces malaysiensis]